ncbi:MAG TPA: CHAT domain-containing protein, partial [Candidatus Obscuribacterales bacterium]
DHLKLLEEVKHIRDVLTTATANGLPMQIDLLAQPDRSRLTQQLEQGNYQVLHYAGHSDLSENGGDLYLVNQHSGLTERLSGDDLAGLLVNNHVALTVFNSCRSGQTAADDAAMDWRQQNLVQALLNRGVPSVVAMAERIPDAVAIAFTRLFYHNLRAGLPIDVSLSRTRQGLISAFGSDQHYWALPILYLQPEFDGYLTKRDRAADDQLSPDAVTLTNGALADPAMATLPTEAAAISDPPLPDPPLPDAGMLDAAPPVPVATGGLSALNGGSLQAEAALELDDDALVASYVQQLSASAAIADAPPMPADAAEVLVNQDSQRAGLEIYDALPEVPLQSAPAGAATPAPPSEAAPVAPTATPWDTAPLPLRSHRTAGRSPEKPLLVWFALGLVGIVGMLGLSLLALRWTGERPAALPAGDRPEVTPADPDPEALIRRGEAAIAAGRYADARDDFALALTQGLLGKADLNAVSDAIWASVQYESAPELAYIKGRITWQTISQLESEVTSIDSLQRQRNFTQQAREAWQQTDARFLEGRIARGFADYAAGDWDGAIAHWEAALTLNEEERQRQPNPAAPNPANAAILHAYAGLVMAHTKLGGLNLAGVIDDPGLSTASPADTAILNAESERELALAQEYFLRLRELDAQGTLAPEALGLVSAAPATWHNWLWTPNLLADWRRDYRYWGTATGSAVPAPAENAPDTAVPADGSFSPGE